ncbi:LacI family DNA-binding transcriptional regulator [Pelagibacterium xiamenense]|uniref:LacI family DNA-binding transcriptional regulator n=1 Tax=Pelagibacterium xiamenense TaxID=2901140 RepID=UPI001E57EAE4|nr:LacI family DNA-binding transcriptional regulator [Pelagibacterium xiamenense]MCD7060210.1 LacI family DNA-binding transcriptional regulator [Pelagibacterium xiamenense]
MKKSRRSGKVTLSDVAAAAGVSAITVSRALRDSSTVSEGALARIERAVADLGYVPNVAAQALASNRTNIIGAIIPSVTNNVFSDVLKGIYNAIEGTPYQLQLGNTRYTVLEEERLVRTFLSQRPAGLIVSGIDQSPATRELLKTSGVPVVQIMETGPDPIDLMVGFSHRLAARAAVEHLIEAGYRRIAFLGARMDPRTQRRLLGYRDALGDAKIDEDLIMTTPRPSSVILGGHLLGDLLARRPDVDAVFCNNDDIALGALFEAQRRNIAVPSGLGICGFNDLEYMEAATPSLTSVRTHRLQMGATAVELLARAIEGNRPEADVVDLGFDVTPRESTRR